MFVRTPSVTSAATLRRVGQWVAKYAELFCEGKPVSCRYSNDDFLLQVEDRYYLFVHGLKRKGDANVTLSEDGQRPRTIKGFNRLISAIHWMDNGEALKFVQDCQSLDLTIDCTGYPYGTDLVVRVAMIDVPTDKAEYA